MSGFHPSAGLDEVSTEALVLELGRRAGLRMQGRCDYCERPWDLKPACRFRERHSPKERTLVAAVSTVRMPQRFKCTACEDSGWLWGVGPCDCEAGPRLGSPLK